jgi:SpoVK/Ycf46/Vps4 family AAA+-type ATPase
MSDNKKVIDEGGAYRFVPEFTTTDLPPGVYYPDYNANGAFVLTKSADFPEDPPDASENTPFDQLVEHEEDFFRTQPPSWDESNVFVSTDAEPTVENDQEAGSNVSGGVKADEIEADWANDGYFPLERYNKGLQEAESNINKFITSKKYYEENAIDYRRSLLFFGPPGTGKSQYVSNKSLDLVKKLNAVVIRLETHAQVEIFAEDGMREVAQGLPGRFKVIVFEELSEVVKHDQIKQYVVNVLDSSQLRDNVLFMATTNNPEKLPENFVDRPGRLDFLHGVYGKDNDAAYIPLFYEHLIGEEYPIDDPEWTEKIAAELTPAYVKGLFITAKERNEGLKTTYERIKKRRQLVQNNFKESSPGFDFGN